VRVCENTFAQGGRTVLIHAVFQDRVDCARLLLDAGADKEAKDEVRSRSAASAVFRPCGLGLVVIF
jgi:hypothetical protein